MPTLVGLFCARFEPRGFFGTDNTNGPEGMLPQWPWPCAGAPTSGVIRFSGPPTGDTLGRLQHAAHAADELTARVPEHDRESDQKQQQRGRGVALHAPITFSRMKCIALIGPPLIQAFTKPTNSNSSSTCASVSTSAAPRHGHRRRR